MADRLMETIQAHAQSRDNWLIVGVHEAGVRGMLSQARAFDLRGPLWGCLGQFRRRWRRPAGGRAAGPGPAPLRGGGTGERPEPVP